jgi:hypothetical protein
MLPAASDSFPVFQKNTCSADYENADPDECGIK